MLKIKDNVDLNKLESLNYDKWSTYYFKKISSNISIKIMENLNCEFHEREEIIILINNRFITLNDYQLLSKEIDDLIKVDLVECVEDE